MINTQRPYDFNPYAAGTKKYGFGRSNPTSGPVDRTGYMERDAEVRMRRNAMLRMLKARMAGNYMSGSYLGGK